MKLRMPSNEGLVRAAAILGLVALPLIVWSVFDPTVWPLMIALTVGQGIGSLSLLLFVVAVIRDLDIVRRLRGKRGAGAATSGSQ